MLHIWFKKLMPRQDEFTELFAEQAKCALESTKLLRQLLEGADGAQTGAKLSQMEKQADKVAEKIYQLLNTSFSTPFRRGEIRALVGVIDSIVDHSEDVAKRMEIYRVGAPTSEMAQMAAKACECAQLILGAVALLGNVSKNAEAINAICAKIHEQEDLADAQHDLALKALYAEGSREPADRARALEKVFDLIEEVIDSCEDAANILGDIVAENA